MKTNNKTKRMSAVEKENGMSPAFTVHMIIPVRARMAAAPMVR